MRVEIRRTRMPKNQATPIAKGIAMRVTSVSRGLVYVTIASAPTRKTACRTSSGTPKRRTCWTRPASLAMRELSSPTRRFE